MPLRKHENPPVEILVTGGYAIPLSFIGYVKCFKKKRPDQKEADLTVEIWGKAGYQPIVSRYGNAVKVNELLVDLGLWWEDN